MKEINWKNLLTGIWLNEDEYIEFYDNGLIYIKGYLEKDCFYIQEWNTSRMEDIPPSNPDGLTLRFLLENRPTYIVYKNKKYLTKVNEYNNVRFGDEV